MIRRLLNSMNAGRTTNQHLSFLMTCYRACVPSGNDGGIGNSGRIKVRLSRGHGHLGDIVLLFQSKDPYDCS